MPAVTDLIQFKEVRIMAKESPGKELLEVAIEIERNGYKRTGASF